ncbi:Ohr family peroxiredoxin [Rubrolithibacter danxiaensis]|uniref:Ohr family peroxiredoxin n=1 Tax=Rubrolithibacter danxiaensis TaxID=3390805 RepID=UPI003BF8C967
MELIYQAEVQVTGGRDGLAQSTDGLLNLAIQKPKELNGLGIQPNPEQLFAAAWGASLLSTIKMFAASSNIDTEKATVTVRTSLNRNASGYLLAADIEVHIPGLSVEETAEIVEEAYLFCPYYKAIRGNIDVKILAV